LNVERWLAPLVPPYRITQVPELDPN